MLKKLCSAAAALVLLSGMTSLAAQPQGSRSCRDNSEHRGTGEATAAAPSHGIKLTWDASTSPAKQVKGYYIFRRESGPDCHSPKSKCERLNPVALIEGTSCTDYTVQSGHTYIYQAQTVSASTAVSKFSNEAKATAH